MGRSKAVFALPIFCCLIITLVTGCAMFSKKDSQEKGQTKMLEPQDTVKFADIPVPAGFKLLNNLSYMFESSGVRAGVLKYHGKADPDRVIDFYKEQMAMYNWDLLNIVQYGQHLMNFDRENETCLVNLVPKGNDVTIVISLGPKSQSAYKKSKEKTPVK